MSRPWIYQCMHRSIQNEESTLDNRRLCLYILLGQIIDLRLVGPPFLLRSLAATLSSPNNFLRCAHAGCNCNKSRPLVQLLWPYLLRLHSSDNFWKCARVVHKHNKQCFDHCTFFPGASCCIKSMSCPFSRSSHPEVLKSGWISLTVLQFELSWPLVMPPASYSPRPS